MAIKYTYNFSQNEERNLKFDTNVHYTKIHKQSMIVNFTAVTGFIHFQTGSHHQQVLIIILKMEIQFLVLYDSEMS